MLNFPDFPESALAYDVLVVKKSFLDHILCSLFDLISLFLKRGLDSNGLILRDADKIIDDRLMHEAFYDVVLIAQGSLCPSPR